jgi:hypothetical protein
MPGTTTYLDTPVVPTAAFTGADVFPVDAELPDRTPTVASVTSLYQPSGVGSGVIPQQIGPYVVDRSGDDKADGVFNRLLRTIQITSAGDVPVPNPIYAGATTAGGPPKTITRDYGFGTSTSNGIVRLGGLQVEVTSWSNSTITAVVPTGVDYRTGQFTVERCLDGNKAVGTDSCPGDSLTSVVGVTLSVATNNMHSQRPPVVLAAGQTIQSAIDAAAPGDLVLVPPGTYNQLVVMTKPIRLQGWGASSTTINTVAVPAENLQAWRDYVGNLLETNPDYLLADQANILGPAPWGPGEIAAAIGGEGSGVTVFGKNQNYNENTGSCIGNFNNPNNEAYCLHNENFGGTGGQVDRPNARIDGFSIIGSSQEAAIIANGHARFLQVSNNRIFNNLGNYAGGVRIGHPAGTFPLVDENADNRDVTIHHNWIAQNAGLDGGGAVALGTGSDRYVVSDNWIAANFSAGWGAGVTHLGLSPGGVIDHNVIVFNETFNQGLPRSGAGIFVGGRMPLPAALTPGSGSVRISNNLLQGNQAAAGDGGGIALVGVNGQDVVNEADVALRYSVSIYNNVIANNVAGLAGGGIALQDAAYVDIVHNTIVHNDSLATAGAAFANPNLSTPQPAGIVSRGHTPLLAAALGGSGFSDPRLANSIVWENRSFMFGPDPGGVIGPGGTFGLLENPAGPYWDLAVLGAPAGSQLNPEYSILTDTTGYSPTNSSAAPSFLATYFNGSRNPTVIEPDGTPGIIVPAAFDEGGNFIRPQFGPLTLHQPPPDGSLFGDYHLDSGVDGLGLNTLFGGAPLVPLTLLTDYDADPRPQETPHIGADQAVVVAPPAMPGLATPISATAPAVLGGGLLNFGVRPNGNYSSTITVSVVLGPVTFGPASIVNLVGTNFSLGADTCSGNTVPDGGFCTIAVNFNGNGSTLKLASLTLLNDGLVNPLALTLIGY